MKRREKSQLPTKTCASCARAFAWRRKWARDWENVLYCSDRCRMQGAARKSNVSGSPPRAR
jgi:hypothetical protein